IVAGPSGPAAARRGRATAPAGRREPAVGCGGRLCHTDDVAARTGHGRRARAPMHRLAATLIGELSVGVLSVGVVFVCLVSVGVLSFVGLSGAEAAASTPPPASAPLQAPKTSTAQDTTFFSDVAEADSTLASYEQKRGNVALRALLTDGSAFCALLARG